MENYINVHFIKKKSSKEIGNIFDTFERILQQTLASDSSKGSYEKSAKCLQCKVLPLCNGGCYINKKSTENSICKKEEYIKTFCDVIENGE